MNAPTVVARIGLNLPPRAHVGTRHTSHHTSRHDSTFGRFVGGCCRVCVRVGNHTHTHTSASAGAYRHQGSGVLP